jgi:hypothetical protein
VPSNRGQGQALWGQALWGSPRESVGVGGDIGVRGGGQKRLKTVPPRPVRTLLAAKAGQKGWGHQLAQVGLAAPAGCTRRNRLSQQHRPHLLLAQHLRPLAGNFTPGPLAIAFRILEDQNADDRQYDLR